MKRKLGDIYQASDPNETTEEKYASIRNLSKRLKRLEKHEAKIDNQERALMLRCNWIGVKYFRPDAETTAERNVRNNHLKNACCHAEALTPRVSLLDVANDSEVPSTHLGRIDLCRKADRRQALNQSISQECEEVGFDPPQFSGIKNDRRRSLLRNTRKKIARRKAQLQNSSTETHSEDSLPVQPPLDETIQSSALVDSSAENVFC